MGPLRILNLLVVVVALTYLSRSHRIWDSSLMTAIRTRGENSLQVFGACVVWSYMATLMLANYPTSVVKALAVDGLACILLPATACLTVWVKRNRVTGFLTPAPRTSTEPPPVLLAGHESKSTTAGKILLVVSRKQLDLVTAVRYRRLLLLSTSQRLLIRGSFLVFCPSICSRPPSHQLASILPRTGVGSSASHPPEHISRHNCSPLPG